MVGRTISLIIAGLMLAACNLSVPQVTPTVAPSRTPSNTPPVTATPSLTPSQTATRTPNPTLIAQLLASDTPMPTRTATATSTPTFTPSDTPAPTATDTLTATSSPTATETNTPTLTATPTPSDTATATDTAIPSATVAFSPTPSLTATATRTPTSTDTPSATPTFSPSPSDTPTSTPTPRPTATNTPRPSPTPLPTIGPSDTPTATNTPTSTLTLTLTVTASDTPLPTVTPLPTLTFTPSTTPRPTATPTRTLSPEELAHLLGTTLPMFTPVPTGSPTHTIVPPTQDVTPTIITATPFASVTAIVVTTTPLPLLPTETASLAPTLTPLPTTTPFPALPPVDPQVRAFVLSTSGGLQRGGVGLIQDSTLFERNPVNPAQYAVTDSSGLLYFTGLNGESASRVAQSPFSQFVPRSREENNSFVEDIAWSPDGQYLAFLINGDKLAVDGVWFFAPGQFPPVQLLVDCPTPDHPGCGIVTSPAGPDLWASLSLDWTNDALLVRTWLPSKNRAGLTVLPITRDESIRDARPPVYEYDYGSWSNDGGRILVSGSGPDGNVYIGWINRDGSFSELVLAARDVGLWVQHAVQRPDGTIVTLGAPFNEGGPAAPMRIYTADGIPLTGPIGDGPPQRVEWSPDRSAALLIVNNRAWLADVNGAVADITAEVGGTRAINWVSGRLPATDGPQGSGNVIVDPVGVRQEPGNPYPAGTRLQVLAPAGLLIRAQPSTGANVVASVVQGAFVVTLSGGPVRDGGYVWWEVQAPDGTNGWLAGEIDGQATIGP